MYKVIYKFKDLQDENTIYNIGDEYPKKGHDTTEKRIAELLGKRNKIGRPLIVEIEDKKPVKKKKSAQKKAD